MKELGHKKQIIIEEAVNINQIGKRKKTDVLGLIN